MTFLQRSFQKRELRDPGFITAIFSNTWLAPLWLAARLYLGYQWLIAGSHKVWGPNRWIFVGGGDQALKKFWQNAITIPQTGKPAISFAPVSTLIPGIIPASVSTLTKGVPSFFCWRIVSS